MDRVLSYFEACVSPEERELAEFVENHGGPENVLGNKNILRELFDRRTNDIGNSPRGRGSGDGVVDQFESLQAELLQGVEKTISDNKVQFQREFDGRLNQLVEAMHGVARNEGNRIITEVTYGPHNKIDDPVSSVTTGHLSTV